MTGSSAQERLRRSARRASDLFRRRRTGAATPVAPPSARDGGARAGETPPERPVPNPPTPRAPLRPETTRPTLSDPVQQANLETYGFAVVDALDEERLELARQLYAELGPAPDDPKVALNWSFHSRSAEYKRDVKQKMLAAFGDVVDDMLVDHEVYLTTFITKWPGPNSGFAPHQDPSLVDERHRRGVTVWIPLGDTGPVDGVDNGMLRFVPGSHRFSSALRVTDVDRSQVAGHEEAIIERHGVGMPSTAGQALVFDNRVIHYSMPNESDEPRVVLSFGVRPREGACTLMRADDDGTVQIFEIDDDFYIDVLPAENHLYEPTVPPRVLEFLAHKVTSNVRELEGALNRVLAHCQLVGRPVTLESTQDLLRDLLRAQDRRVTIEEIQKKVAEHFNIRLADMVSARKQRAIARPRQIAMYLAKRLTSRSLPEIGRKFGGRDHTTVMHGVKKVEELMAGDPAFAEDVELLERMLES